MTERQLQIVNDNYANIMGGKKWTCPLFDFERTEWDDDLEEDVTVDLKDNGRLLRVRFAYDASKNPTGQDFNVEIWADPEGAMHCDTGDLADEWAYYRGTGALVDIPNPEQPPVCEHVAGEPVEENRVEPADCVTDGSYDLVTYCTICGEELSRESQVIPAPGHQAGEPVEENATPASCTTGAYKEIVTYCTVCGTEISRVPETTEAPGHTAGEPVEENVVAGTCQTEGSKDVVTYCTVCGAEISRETVNTGLGAHVASSKGKIIVNPTTTSDGVIRFRCEVCGEYVEELDEAIPAITQFDLTIADAQAVEGETVTMSLDLANSQYGISDIAFYAFWDDAITDMTITLGEGIYNANDELSVKDIKESNFAQFLINAGIDNFDREGKTLKKVGVFKPDTGEYTTSGTIINFTFTAPEAGEYKVGILNQQDWAANYYVDGVLATPTIDYVVPSVLEGTLTVEAEAHEHTAGDPVEENVVPATCTEAGSKDLVVYCTECGEEISRETVAIDPLGHDFVAGEVVPATCTEAGYTVYTCSRCDATENRDEVPAPGHTPAEAVEENVVPATCTEAGSKDLVVYCSVCGAEISRETQVIEAPGHVPAEEYVREGDFDVLYCTVCGAELDRKPVEVPGVVLDVVLNPGAQIAVGEINNETRTINITSKKDVSKVAFNLILKGANFMLTDDAFAAGNKVMIKNTTYDAKTDAAGIRYFQTFSANGFEQTYQIEVTYEGETYLYTVNVTFDHSPACSGVEPGYTANAELTGFDPEIDNQINVVAQPGKNTVAFRLLLSKGSTVAVKSGNVHTYQTSDKGATYAEVNEIDPSAFVYFQSVKGEDTEYDLTVSYANGETVDYHVVVSFPEE